MKNIVQINVRLTEGGAACIALDIHRRLLNNNNYTSNFLYGYGRGINKNSQEEDIKNCNMLASKPSVLTNYITYKLFNKDYCGIIDNKNSTIRNADIVHLHVTHSYFMNFEKTINALLLSRKKIIWTIHDFWPMTGRCAITDTCDQWKKGCGQCPTLKNYPPSWMDNSKKTRIKKLDIINNMLNSGAYLVSPSKHLYDTLTFVYGKRENIILINNGIDIDTEKNIAKKSIHYSSKLKKIGIVAHDLSYNGKTNYELVKRLLASSTNEYEFHFIGKNNPFHGENVFSHGYIDNKNVLLDLMSTFDCLLFTSQVDNYPLILCESLSLGVPVIATESNASIEIINKLGGKVFDESGILEFFKEKNNDFLSIYNVCRKEDLAKKAITIFSGNAMMEKYINAYEILLCE